MNWFIQLFSNHSSAVYVILVYSVVIASGVALGKLGYKGVSFGVACVLFTGIIMGHFGFDVDEKILDYIKEFGLILFVYTMGLQVGPGFFASLKNQGFTLNLLAFAAVMFSAIAVIVMYYTTGISMPQLVGLMSGAVTNTPGLGAAQQTVHDLSTLHPELKTMPSLGTNYALAYPGGVIGIILVMIILKWLLRINTEKENKAFEDKAGAMLPQPGKITLEIKNPALIGKSIQTIFDTLPVQFVVSRVMHDGKVVAATKDLVLHENDVIRIIANPKDLDRLRTLIGTDSNVDMYQSSGSLISKKVHVTQHAACAKPLASLDLIHHYNITITRVLRSGIEFIPNGHTRLQFGDIVTVVGEEHHVDEVSGLLGNSEKRLREPNIAALFFGIALGVLAGSIPFAFPGVPVPVKLGLAGGPLIVAILISRFGSMFPITSYVTKSANYMVREMGIVLFLSSVGLSAGPNFVKNVFTAQGAELLGLAAIITVVPLVLTSLIARFIFKLNFLEICGLLAGASTDPPALSFAIQVNGSDAPAVSYAGVYPLTMFLRILIAQLLILFFIG